jgi:hypothetical protein
MRKLTAKTILSSCIFTLLLSILLPVVLTTAASADSGLTINGAIVNDIVKPGNNYSYTTTIQSSADAPPMDILVDASGFGNDLNGAWLPVAPGNDNSPYSALNYIKDLNPTSFHLNSGGSQNVTWNVMIPANVGSGTRYAMLYIHTSSMGEGTMGYVLAAEIPMMLTVNGSTILLTGEITNLAVVNMSSGNPIEISTILRNTGNSDYRARNEVRMTDENGSLVATAYTLLSGDAIIPTYSREFVGSLVLTGQKNELPPGTYNIESKAMLLDGTVLATKMISITVNESYKYPTGNGSSLLCPGVDGSSGYVTVFTNEVPYCIDRSAAADLKICFSNTGTVTGKVITGKYAGVPPVPIFFYAPEKEGGTGKMPVKFVSVRVDGFDSGNAQITVFYTNAEVNGFNEESLILAYWDGAKWQRLTAITVDPSANTVTGIMPVSALGQCTPIGLGGSTGAETQKQGYPLWPFLLVAGVAVVGIIAYMLRRKKKRNTQRIKKLTRKA